MSAVNRSTNLPMFFVAEIKNPENIDFLQSRLLPAWREAADKLDAQCFEPSYQRKNYHTLQNSQAKCLDLLGIIKSMASRIKELSQKEAVRVFVSFTSKENDIQAIAIINFQKVPAYIEYLVTNPLNIAIPNLQEKKYSGAVLAIFKKIFESEEFIKSTEVIEGECVPTSEEIFKKLGGEASKQKASSFFYTRMGEKAGELKRIVDIISPQVQSAEEPHFH